MKSCFNGKFAQTYHIKSCPRHSAETHEQRINIVELTDLRRSRIEYDTADRRRENKVSIVKRKWTEPQEISLDRHTQLGVVVSIVEDPGLGFPNPYKDHGNARPNRNKAAPLFIQLCLGHA